MSDGDARAEAALDLVTQGAPLAPAAKRSRGGRSELDEGTAGGEGEAAKRSKQH